MMPYHIPTEPTVMPATKGLQQRIAAFHDRVVADPHHRYRSWEHCYRFFRARTPAAIIADKDAAALQLGFYLASWGLYRGSSFLLQHTYTVHRWVIDLIAGPFRFATNSVIAYVTCCSEDHLPSRYRSLY